MAMSKTTQAQEEKLAREAKELADAKANEKNRYYVAPAERFQIGNFVKEKYEFGRITRPEASLEFSQNMYVTGDPKVQKFIESSNPFKNGHVKRADSMEHARQMVHQIRIGKSVKVIDNTASV